MLSYSNSFFHIFILNLIQLVKMAGGVRVKGHSHKHPAEEKNITEQADDNEQESAAAEAEASNK